MAKALAKYVCYDLRLHYIHCLFHIIDFTITEAFVYPRSLLYRGLLNHSSTILYLVKGPETSINIFSL